MTNDDGTISVDVAEYMNEGLAVYDADRKKVGKVLVFDREAGYMTVQHDPFTEQLLYIPFSAVTHIDRREVFVAGLRDDLRDQYSEPPPRHIEVTPRVNLETGEDESLAITTEPSGYDGTPVAVDVADVGRAAHHIAPGFHVLTSELEDLGTVKEYDRATGKMVVERGLVSKHDIVVPLAAVETVDRDSRTVYLSVAYPDLERDVVGSLTAG